MKALVYEGSDNPSEALQVREVPTPVPGPDDVLVRVAYSTAGMTDWLRFGNPLQKQRPGLMGRFSDALGAKGNPLGGEVSGTVAAVGENVRHVRVGDEVFGATAMARGGWAEYAVTAGDETCRKPENASLAQAATLGVSPTVALGALRVAVGAEGTGLETIGSLAGKRVLVNGSSGGVGLSAVQIAASQGAEVVGVCGASSFDAVLAHGAQQCLDRTRPDFQEAWGTFDAIIAANGYQPSGAYRRLLKKGGTYVVVGGALRQLLVGVTLAPVTFSLTGKHARSVVYASIPKELPTIAALVERGGFAPVVDEEVDVLDLPRELPRIIDAHHTGKVVVRIAF